MKLKNLNPLLPLKKIFNAVKGRIEKARALAQSDEQLATTIKNYMSQKFKREAGFFDVTIKPTTFYQQGNPHKGKSVRVTMKDHVNDYALVQRMASDLGQKFTLSNRYLVGLYNGPAPIRQKRLEEDAQAAAEAEKAQTVDKKLAPKPAT